jgi:OOP family OmpA-OmpF porin
MNKKLLIALGLAGLASTTVVMAEDPEATTGTAEAAPAYTDTMPATTGEYVDDRWYAAPFGSYLHPGGDTQGFDGWGGGLGLGKMINEYFNVEIRGFWTGYGNNFGNLYGDRFGGNTDLTGGTVDLQYYFFRDAFSPYTVLALGGMNTSTRVANLGYGKQQSSFIFEVGLGATYEILDNLLLRGDVRYRGNTADSFDRFNGTFHDDGVLNDLVVNMGFVVPFGEKPGPVAAVPAPVDDCSTRDSDHDGVNDCDDKCPGTMAGTKVDDQGCPIVMELRGVNFKFDSAELTEGAKAILDGVAGQLAALPDKRDIEVAGFASYEGRPQAREHNLRLSQRRSESVARYLKAQGVTNKLYAKGYGTEYPIASNDTEEGRIKNRRVELRWMGD